MTQWGICQIETIKKKNLINLYHMTHERFIRDMEKKDKQTLKKL